MTQTIKFRGADIPVKITYAQAWGEFRDLGLNLFKVFEDGVVLQKILADDETMLKVWFSYIKDHASTLEDALQDLEPEDMHDFREKFWEAVVLFINPQMRPALREMEKLLKKELASPGKTLRRVSSELLEEQESIQVPTQSDNSS